ncbi:hypothetical protein AX15_001559 [Amanita polypyramis BW_CC]|nr:hypothetical protein AX15_001559 [Amanita polypyramis BW_CC]
MLPQLPFDVLVHICRSIPASRLDDEDVKTLSHCLQVNRLFRDACVDPFVWKTHYHCRYTLSEPRLESERKLLFGNDWLALYTERRRIDKIAMAQLQGMVMDRAHRYDCAEALLQMSLDVWDALDIDCQLPIPAPFRISPSEPDGVVSDHALTRRYWARSMADTIVRCAALDVWKDIIDGDNNSGPADDSDVQSGASFEFAMSAFSCFFGRPLSETTARLDQLGDECKAFLIDEGCTLDPSDPCYDLPRICRYICLFMYSQGFGVAEPRLYRKMLNHFPHSYLITNKRTLPISLVHVFIAISRRIGIGASPVNFPGTVLVNVATENPQSPNIIINPSTMDPATCVMNIPVDIEAITSDLPVPVDSLPGFLVPSKAKAMLRRASHNILFAFQEDIDVDFSQWQPAMFAAVTAQFLLQTELPFLRVLVESFRGLTILDCSTFILNKLAPMVSQPYRDLLEQRCDPIKNEEAIVAGIRRTRLGSVTVRYFVGMVIRHIRYGFVGCIIGWDFTCRAPEEWIKRMNVDQLKKGRKQPFYRIIVDDGTSRYVAEENVVYVDLNLEIVQRLFSSTPELPVYFEDVELGRDGKGWSRGRFLLSPDSLRAYPNDEEVGALWVREGKFPY